MPFQFGTRHAVIVTDPIEPLRTLLTADAVLHGSPEAPCLAAFEAFLVSAEQSGAVEPEQAIVLLGSQEHSFLFRVPAANRGEVASVEYRTMSCRPDPGAEAPIEVFKERGTLIEAR